MAFNTINIIRIPSPLPAGAANSFRAGSRGRRGYKKVPRNHKVRGGMPWMESRERYYLILQTVYSPRFSQNMIFGEL